MIKIIRRLLIVAVLLALAGGYYQWHSYEQKVELRDDALLYFKEEDYAKTISYLNKALEKKALFSGNIDADMTCYLAESYYQMEEYDQAIELYDALLSKDADNAMYYQLKGKCLKTAGDCDQAVGVFEQGWDETKDADFLKRICDIYIEQEEYDKALTYAQEGAKQSGESKAALMYQVIIIYEKSEDYAAALQAAEEYCALYPDDEDAERERIFLSTRV